jgi:hypothetical protein
MCMRAVESDDEMVADENLQDTEDDQDANAKNTWVFHTRSHFVND